MKHEEPSVPATAEHHPPFARLLLLEVPRQQDVVLRQTQSITPHGISASTPERQNVRRAATRAVMHTALSLPIERRVTVWMAGSMALGIPKRLCS